MQISTDIMFQVPTDLMPILTCDKRQNPVTVMCLYFAIGENYADVEPCTCDCNHLV